MKKIIFIPTWRCNLKCEYCDYSVARRDAGYILHAFGKNHYIKKELEWWKWAVHFTKLGRFHLEITGGEPTVYKDLDMLLKFVACQDSWSITSNTLNTEMIEKIPSRNCVGWAASYHFHSDKMFFDNLAILRRHDFRPRITIVISPENHRKAIQKVKEFKRKGYDINIHPILKQGLLWEDHQEIMDKIKKLSDGQAVMVIDDIDEGWKEKRFKSCPAGSRYFVLMPDGKVLRCYSQILTDDNLGYIDNFTPTAGNESCEMGCMFPCDRQLGKGD